ncbi:lytic transglycosylase domain-containing protein [Aminobacter sp. MSH1]|uniref:lytic transglycosylase domain-containing protein n=1 Tax=Aminobacter sp. MSH1 TaxID=374606 RepID=UPI001FE23F5E|nr:lytic transglycosylase domain-containing protein [Aminobacter sp. MSH1]
MRLSQLSASNPLIDRAPVKPFDPIARQTAAARSAGQGRPDACQSLRALIAPQFAASKFGRRSRALDGSEHGGRLPTHQDSGACAVTRSSMTMLSAFVILALPASSVCAEPAAHRERSAHFGNAISLSDPWSAHIREAAKRFAIPERLLRAVMHVESIGDIHAVSSKGAMGLMQIMPPTWQELRTKYRLGNDPYQPRDNILAGAAYLREMLDRFGPNGFLAAYNAGPGRYEEHLSTSRPLPRETIDYVRKLAPLISGAVPISTSARQGAGRASPLGSTVFTHTGNIRNVAASYGDRGADVETEAMFTATYSSSMEPPIGGAVTDLTAFEPLSGISSGSDTIAPNPAAHGLFVQRSSAASQ